MPTNFFNPYNPINLYPQTVPQQPTRNSIVWVQGIEGAKAMQVPPSGVALFMDSENEGLFYIKTTDNIGISNLRTFRYEEVLPKTAAPDNSGYVTHGELEKVVAAAVAAAMKGVESE